MLEINCKKSAFLLQNYCSLWGAEKNDYLDSQLFRFVSYSCLNLKSLESSLKRGLFTSKWLCWLIILSSKDEKLISCISLIIFC